jgi:hypothetical protein
MGLFDFLGNIFKPAVDLVDEIHVSDEERGKLRLELSKVQQAIHAKTTDLMIAEAKSDHFIVAAWRPICALSFVIMIVLGGYGVIQVPQQVYDLSEIFLGTYAGGRSLEKVSKGLFKR